MSINTAPIYDYEAWILQCPDFDWNNLAPEPEPEEVTATAPTFDDEADTYKIPQKAGVQYLVDGVAATSGVKSVGDVDTTIVVTAEAKEGYVLAGTASWTGVFAKAPVDPPA